MHYSADFRPEPPLFARLVMTWSSPKRHTARSGCRSANVFCANWQTRCLNHHLSRNCQRNNAAPGFRQQPHRRLSIRMRPTKNNTWSANEMRMSPMRSTLSWHFPMLRAGDCPNTRLQILCLRNLVSKQIHKFSADTPERIQQRTNLRTNVVAQVSVPESLGGKKSTKT